MTPILWSFRRCPYAMRARLGIAESGVRVELREIVLRAKPEPFLETSPSGTVPCLNTGAQVIDESFDVMRWALAQNDPNGWLDMPAEGDDQIATCDGPFKKALDRYKYAIRFDDVDVDAEKQTAIDFLTRLNDHIGDRAFLFRDAPKLADYAILPFVRQFAHVDQEWFYAQPLPNVIRWLDAFKSSDRFKSIMTKYAPWADGDDPIYFP